MSLPLQGPNTALALLRDLGYNLSVSNNSLLRVHDVPYLNSKGDIARGVIAFPIAENNGQYSLCGDHCAYFYPETPYQYSGGVLSFVIGTNEQFDIPGIGLAPVRISRKPVSPVGSNRATLREYQSIEEKVMRYTEYIQAPAQAKDSSVSCQTGRTAPDMNYSGPFLIPDSASSRVGIGYLNHLFEDQNVGIIGLGGTGSYILDLIAKTYTPEIHLYDADTFQSHNAFRSPGAVSPQEIEVNEPKVVRYARLYSAMRHGIIAHDQYASSDCKDQLARLTFVFIAVDNDLVRRELAHILEEVHVPFIDVGIFASVICTDGIRSLTSRVRTTIWSEGKPQPLPISAARSMEDDYSSNIQIAELNALNAAFAVMRWKKYIGYYTDNDVDRASYYQSNIHALMADYYEN